jgi:hypothetical protein
MVWGWRPVNVHAGMGLCCQPGLDQIGVFGPPTHQILVEAVEEGGEDALNAVE